MNYYQWKGFNSRGERLQGLMQSLNSEQVKADLEKQGIVSKIIVKKRTFLWQKKKISSTELASFSRQMASLNQAGIPLLQSFEILAKNQTNLTLKALIDRLKKDVESGFTLAESLQKHPLFFNHLFCHLINAGEKSGCLGAMLIQVADYQEKTELIKKKIKKSLIYPTFVLFFSLVLSIIFLTFVIPQFESLFHSFNAELPLLTLFMINLSRFFLNYWYLFVLFHTVLIIAFLSFKNTIQFKQSIDLIKLKAPIVGPIFINASIARFARTLGLTYLAGLSLVKALDLVATVSTNLLYKQVIEEMRQKIVEGQSIHIAMSNRFLFPVLVNQMISIGEESGRLDYMLAKIADLYEEELNNKLDYLNGLLEPLIMTIVGFFVGILVIAMYLPIFKLGAIL